MSYKKYFFCLLFSPIIYFSCLACYLIYDDILQIFPKGYFIEEKFTDEMREQNKGIIDNVDFDSIILGTSMLKCSSAKEASQLLHGNFVNLSMSAGSFYERQFILSYLFQNKKVNTILYSFDFGFENTFIRQTRFFPWTMLYDDNPYNDVLIYYDARFILNCLKKISFLKKYNNASIDFFDRPISWIQSDKHMGRFGGLENWVQYFYVNNVREFIMKTLPDSVVNLPRELPSKYIKKEIVVNAIQHIEDTTIFFIKKHPETNFHIIIPPYYRYKYAVMRQISGSDYGLYQERIRHIVNASAQYPNLKVYGFEDMDFLDDIANYKDTSHYHHSINSMMTHAIADGTHMLTPENVEPYLAKCDELAQAFDIRKFYDDACALMVKHGLDPKTGKKVK